MKKLIFLFLLIASNVNADQVTYEPVIMDSGDSTVVPDNPKVWDNIELIKVVVDKNHLVQIVQEDNQSVDRFQTQISVEASLTSVEGKQSTVVRSTYLDSPRDYNGGIIVPQQEIDNAVNELAISLEQEYLK